MSEKEGPGVVHEEPVPEDWEERPIGNCSICGGPVYPVDIQQYKISSRQRNPSVMHERCGW